MSTPTNKGNFDECKTCLYHHKGLGKYPCDLSHKAIREATKDGKCTKKVER